MPVAEAMAPLQSAFILVEGGENSDPRRMPMTSTLYELGGPGTRQTTMRPSGRTAQVPEAGGELIRLSSVYVQSGAVPGLLRTYAVSPESVITAEAPCRERLAPHETGRGTMEWERGGPSSAVAVMKRRHGERGKLDLGLMWNKRGLVCKESRTRVGWMTARYLNPDLCV